MNRTMVGTVVVAGAMCRLLGAQTASVSPIVNEPPRNWHQLDAGLDGFPGISSERAMRELLAGMKPGRTAIVAIIDSGVDTAHVDLHANLWMNAKEMGRNKKDDDKNGYVDDVRGWDFISARDGTDVGPDTHEITRVARRCGTAKPPYSAERCATIVAEFERERMESAQGYAQVRQIDSVYRIVSGILRTAVAPDTLSVARITALAATDPPVQAARNFYLRFTGSGMTASDLEKALKGYQSRAVYGFNADFDSRKIVGDDSTNVNERGYGSPDVTGPDQLHGTHVAGIIGAVRDNGIGIDGIAPAVRLMILRAVPDGDERDKDIANAIRYAVDNGANVINMSFGKGYSPQKAAVDAAVSYADAHGVLMVHGAGNDGADLTTKESYPTPIYENGERARLWIEVGASSWKSGDSLVAVFSNYGKTRVDVFAPGVDILSTVSGDAYERDSGTSMAAPVVTGLAGLLMSYFPKLSAADVRDIILASTTSHAGDMVLAPGGKSTVAFGSLSVTGGIVNAYTAVKMAQARSSPGR